MDLSDEMPNLTNDSMSPIDPVASRGNPFSIDYILSANSAALEAQTKQHQQEQADQATLVDQLNFINQQRAQLMAAAAAVATTTSTSTSTSPLPATSSSYSSTNSYSSNTPTISLARSGGNKQLQHGPTIQQHGTTKIELQQQHQACHQQGTPTQQAHPNFLYFMACMLFQQQQQQQALAAAAAVANQQQQNSRQPINMTTASGPMDSLAILARLTGPPQNVAPGSSGGNSNSASNNIGLQQHDVSSTSNSSIKYNHIGNRQPLIRHQPYSQAIHHPHSHSPTNNQQPIIANATIDKTNQQSTNNRQMVDFSSILSLGFDSAQLFQQEQQKHYRLAQHHHDQQQSQLLERLAGDKLGPIRANVTPRSTVTVGQSSQQSCLNNKNRMPQQPQPQQQQQQEQQQHQQQTVTQAAATTRVGNSFVHPVTGEKLDGQKPAHSYIGLIGMCILSSPDKRMVLNDIYQFILDYYPYYRNRGSGWRNSVRHNLSLNECFQKSGRAANGKGHYWTIHPANMEDFMNGDFRRRRAQRKVRRYNMLDVPSDESDDESTEDATRPPLPEHFKRSIEMHKRLETLKKQQKQTQHEQHEQLQMVAPNGNQQMQHLSASGGLTPLAAAALAASSSPFAQSLYPSSHLH